MSSRALLGSETPAAASGAPAPADLQAVTRVFTVGDTIVRALDEVYLTLRPGEFTAVVGRSGSGKSTLLNVMAGIDRPSSGSVSINGRRLDTMSDDALTRMRRDEIGVVYQFFNLLPTLTVRENVALPALLGGVAQGEALREADLLLKDVDLAHRSGASPHTLSGGELQRAAVARALVRRPRLVLADEPTGNLDSRTAEQILDLLGSVPARSGAALVMVTHSREAAARATRLIEMVDGRIAADSRPAE